MTTKQKTGMGDAGWTAYMDAVRQHDSLGHKDKRVTFWDVMCRECDFRADLTIVKGNPFDFDRGHLAVFGCWVNGKQIEPKGGA